MNKIEWFFSTILSGLLAFIATNTDDLLLLVLLFSVANFSKRSIILGQYLGFIVIIAISSLGFFTRWIIPLKWIGFLGLVPIALGIMEMRKLLWKQKLTDEIPHLQADTSPSFVSMIFRSWLDPQIYGVAAITVGNGSDNIATYIPLFATGDFMRMGILICFFLLLVGLWCYIGHTLVSFPAIADITKQYGHVLLPFIFILLGILILIETGALVF